MTSSENDDYRFQPMPEILCEIPSLFHSLEFDGPFKQCCLCERPLLESGDQAPRYVIERIFHRSEPIVEYAICERCHVGQLDCISAESLKALRQFWSERFNAQLSRAQLMVDFFANKSKVDDWVERCIFTDRLREQCDRYQVAAIARGNQLMLNLFPVMISGDASKQISELLSEQTKGWMSDFVSDQFGMPPEFSEYPPVLV